MSLLSNQQQITTAPPRVPLSGHPSQKSGSLPKFVPWIPGLLACIAVALVLPPILIRSIVPSALVAGLGFVVGIVVFFKNARRAGVIGAGLCCTAAAIAIGATLSGETNLKSVVVWSILIGATLRFATPLIFAALGGVISERSGVINVALEGMMIAGAFFSVWGADLTGSWVGGIFIGMAAGALFGLIHAFFVITLAADQIVCGMAINLLALGVTGFLFIDIYGERGTPHDVSTIPNLALPLKWLGPIGRELSHMNLLVWFGLIAVAVVSFFLFRTPLGLRTRAVGENPLAADTAGVSVTLTRYLAVTCSGVLAALGGTFLSLGFVHSFTQNMTAGRGFIALAAVIFGKWYPRGALLATLLFGISSALAQRMPVFSAHGATLFQTLPYVLTLIAVAGLVGASRPPKALGLPYRRR